MSLFGSVSIIAILASRVVIATVNTEDFVGEPDSWSWNTPGVDEPGFAFESGSGPTPSGRTGPNGGANPTTRAIDAGLPYGYAETSTGVTPQTPGSVSPFTMEGPEFNAGVGTFTLTFDLHARWNGADNATFAVQGWNGTAWQTIGPTVDGGLQTFSADESGGDEPYVASSTLGTYSSTGFTNPDFKFRFRLDKPTAGGDRFQYDTAIANVRITGPTSAGGTPPPVANVARALALSQGLRTIHVATTGNNNNSGLNEGQPKRTIQSAVNATRAGDVVLIEDGEYDERVTANNRAGTSQRPILIAARNAGQVTIFNVFEAARDGDPIWRDDGGGVFSTARSTNNRPWLGSHNGDFLMAYLSEGDLRAASITAFSGIAGANRTINKPPYGFAFQNNRIFVRLRNNVNPNGQSILFTRNFASSIFRCVNCDNFIIDGINFVGAGNSTAVTFDRNCANPVVHNCTIELSRLGVRCSSNTLLSNVTYQYVGFDTWRRDLFALDDKAQNGPFVLTKGYYTAQAAGVGGGGNALLEGGFEAGFSQTQTNILIEDCLIGPVFEGSRLGEFDNSTMRRCVIQECGDDGVQNESFRDENTATNNRIHDNLFLNNFKDVSHQGTQLVGDAFVYRNLFVHTDNDVLIPNSDIIKMNRTPPAANVFYYQNTFVLNGGGNIGGNLRIWSDFGGPISNANNMKRFFNNVVVIPFNLNDGPGPNPQNIERNAVVSNLGNGLTAFIRGNGGVFAGVNQADMQLNGDFSLQPGSPAAGIGRALPARFPDTRTGANANNDAGAFPLGETPGADFPRPTTIVVRDVSPPRWTNPGAP